MSAQDRMDLVQLSYESDGPEDVATISNRKSSYSEVINTRKSAENGYEDLDDENNGIEMESIEYNDDKDDNLQTTDISDNNLYPKLETEYDKLALKTPPINRKDHQYFEIESTPVAKEIVRGSNSSSGGMSYFVDIDNQDNLKAPIMGTTGFLVKDTPGNNNNQILHMDSHA